MTNTNTTDQDASEREKEFIRGLAVGAAYMNRCHGEPQYAKWIIEDNGFTREDLIDAEVEEYDLKEIYKDTP